MNSSLHSPPSTTELFRNLDQMLQALHPQLEEHLRLLMSVMAPAVQHRDLCLHVQLAQEGIH